MKEIQEIINATKDLTLLYVEDNKDARTSTLNILQEFFNTIIIAEDGEDGLAKYKVNKIDLVLTDINMPTMSGLEMLKAIHQINPDVISLILSAYNESDFFIESIKIGVEGYLLKPIDFEQLLSVLKKISLKVDALRVKTLLQQYKEITDASSIVTIIDKNKKIKYVNDAFCKISGYSKEDLIGEKYLNTLDFLQEQNTYDEIWDTISEKKKIYKGILKYVSKRGAPFYLETTIKPILSVNGDILEYVALRHDVTAIMNPYRQLIDFIKSSKEPLVVLMRIENFENLENLYGERVSQEIQVKFTHWLEQFILERGNYFNKVYMLRNGEYAIASDISLLQGTVAEILEKLYLCQIEINRSRIDIGELDYDISIVMSVAYQEEPLENAKYGLKKLFKSKQNFILANNLAQEVHKEAQENIEMLKILKYAIEHKNIISYFQPIVNNKTQEIEKYESLVRLIDINGNIISPYFFLNISKQAKYYTQITSIVLDNSFAALLKTDKDISINISVLDIQNDVIRLKILNLLERNTKEAKRVTLELLEDEAVNDFTLIQEFISKVKHLGVKIAIDDFGSGYSNFVRLLNFQPDILKIDGSLIKNITRDELSLSVVRTMVTFAKEQNLQVVAEYVEDKEVYDILHALGVEYSQGYYFGKPEPLEA
jgi:PAS domain S-box-containing protein